MEAYRHINQFMTSEEVRHFNDIIQQNASLFSETYGRGGLGPRYRVINGDQILSQLAEIATFGQKRVLPMVENMAGEPLHFMGFSKRSMRIQVYDKKHHGFRWHFDGHSYTALLCLKNTNCGQTQLISPGLSRVLRFFLYPLYAVPRVFSIMPYQAIAMESGDLFLMRGSRLLHRGVTLGEEGERILAVYTYDEIDKKPNPIRDKIARALNY
jgi:hypothetical protein